MPSKKDPVVQAGEQILRHKAQPVAKKDIGSPKLTAIIKKMSRILGSEEFGVAIAAPQIGESMRLFLIAGKLFKADESEQTPPDKVFINPEITRLSKKTKEMAEGCLSVRGLYGTVRRHEKATIKAASNLGEPFTYHASGLLAQIFQHECDHLDGILYTDKATDVRKEKRDE